MERTQITTPFLPLAYRAYQDITSRYAAASPSWPFAKRILLEWPIRLAAISLGTLSGFRFPRRAIGGWWWIWKYRFEMLVGWYEYPTALWVRRLLRPGNVAVDVGAHIGYFSCILSRLVGSSGKVFAFEPSPENFPLLVHNLSQRRALNTIPVQAAVSDEPGQPLLYVSPGHSNHSLFPGYTKSEGALPVDAVSLDQYLNSVGIDHLDLIKIDAEGAEPRILAGMKSILSANSQIVLIIEINPNALGAADSSPQALLAILANHGFVPRLIMPDCRLADPEAQDFKGVPNLLCLRPDHWEDLTLVAAQDHSSIP
jgi:FkbM family methyltransferase